MNGSTGGEQLRDFEGLVHATARMWAAQVRREEDDLAQELRVRVWRACETYNPARGLPLERHVFQCVTNKIKDFKRDAAREAARREKYNLSFLHIEDMLFDDERGQESFDGRYNFVDRDEVYRCIDEGKFVVPATVTEAEGNVLLMLMMDASHAEIALRLGVAREQVEASVRSLRRKMADWRPSLQDDSSRVVPLAEIAA